MRSTTFIVVGILLLTSVSWGSNNQIFLEDNERIQDTSSQSNPIRNESSSSIPADVDTYDLGLWTEWYHHVDDWPIDDQEEKTYYFYIDNSLLGSDIVAVLDIYDAWFSAEPDLDLYLYNPNSILVAASAQEGDLTEEIHAIADVTGLWSLVVSSYDGDGWFDLYRLVVSNAYPVIESIEMNIDQPHINEPYMIDACGSFDLEDELNLTFSWSIDGVPSVQDDDGDGQSDCYFFSTIEDSNSHQITLELSDTYGLTSVREYNIQGEDPGWFLGDGDQSQSTDLGLIGEFRFNQFTSIWTVPEILPGEPFRIQLGFVYELNLTSEGSASVDVSQSANPDDANGPHFLMYEKSIQDVDYQLGFRPSLQINVWMDNESLSFNIPMISTEEMYVGEPSMSIAGIPLVYYWEDFVDVELGLYYEGASELGFSGDEIFTLAEIDLYPVVEWMVDNLAASMGQVWVDTATNFLSFFIDIAIPLNFDVEVTAQGWQEINVNSICSNCEDLENYFTIASPAPTPATSTQLYYPTSAAYEISSVLSVLSYVQVEVSPYITLGFEVNDEVMWESTIYEFASQGSEHAISWTSDDSTDFSWNLDSDLDGYPDVSDAFPEDASEWEDTDLDGVGDNADVFPDDSTESRDTDADGVGDNSDEFPDDPSETRDSDDDGVGDNADAFPSDSTETEDTDLDGVGDNSDAFPLDPLESKDTDSDGVGDNSDAFIEDPTEFKDTDADGVGDNADAFPENPSESKDSDSDGVGDNADAFPSDASESSDSDSDGVGDNSDAFPHDPSETLDSDSDGVGDNADAFPFNPKESLDTDLDGVGDNMDFYPEDPTRWEEGEEDSLPGFGALMTLTCLIFIAISSRRKP